MASDGEDMDLTSTESEVSAAETDTDTKEDAHLLDSETDEESLDVEVVPATSDDADMEELLGQLEDYTPTVPDALTMHILKSVRIVFGRGNKNGINLIFTCSLALHLWTHELYALFLYLHKSLYRTLLTMPCNIAKRAPQTFSIPVDTVRAR